MKRLLLSHLAPVVIINLGNACAYLFQIVLARSLSPADVGAFNALLSAVTIVAAPAAVAPLAVTRMLPRIVAEAGRDPLALLVARTSLGASIIAGSVAVTAILFAGPISQVLKIEQMSTMVWFATLMALTLIYPVAGGWFQSAGRNVAMAAILGGVPILRLFLGTLLVVPLGLGLDGALAGSAVPCAILFLVAFLTLWRSESGRGRLPPALVRDTLRFLLPAAASTTLIYALFNVDVMLVRALRPALESGQYAVAAVFSRIPFLVPAALATIFFSDITRRSAAGEGGEARHLLMNLAGVGALAFGLAAVLAIFAEPALGLLAGPTYAEAAPLLRILSFAMAGLSLLNMLVTFGMARDDHRPLGILTAGVLGFAAFALLARPDAHGIALGLAVAIAAMTATALILTLVRPRSPASTSS